VAFAGFQSSNTPITAFVAGLPCKGGLTFSQLCQNPLVEFAELETKVPIEFPLDFWAAYNRFSGSCAWPLLCRLTQAICNIGNNKPATLEWIAQESLRTSIPPDQILGPTFKRSYGK